jgi:hypothetical protein
MTAFGKVILSSFLNGVTIVSGLIACYTPLASLENTVDLRVETFYVSLSGNECSLVGTTIPG